MPKKTNYQERWYHAVTQAPHYPYQMSLQSIETSLKLHNIEYGYGTEQYKTSEQRLLQHRNKIEQLMAIDHKLKTATQAHDTGNLEEAKKIYLEVLSIQPTHHFAKTFLNELENSLKS